jgi:hypothetical protein
MMMTSTEGALTFQKGLGAVHAEQDPATETNARPATRADYEEMLRASLGN